MQLRKKYIQRKIVKAAETSPNKNKSRNLGKEKLAQNNNQSLYLNKVLQQNLGSQKADSNYPPFRENISNFHSNIQNILSNDEMGLCGSMIYQICKADQNIFYTT